MPLLRKDVLVRPNSDKTEEEALKWTRNWLNNFQNADDNKDENGKFKNYFFADVFFAKNKKIIRMFSDECKNAFDMPTNNDGSIALTMLNVQAIENQIIENRENIKVINNNSTSQTEAEVI